MRHSLRRSLRRLCWVGPLPDWPKDMPVIAYSNHHHFLDGHILWFVTREFLQRPFIVWMEDFDRYPFFAAQGVMPFPPDDPIRRSRTIRRTRQALLHSPRPLLAYFAGGQLTSPEEGLPSDTARTFERLGRIMPRAIWSPLAIHITWWGDSHPTALVTAGSSHREPVGDEIGRLQSALDILRSPNPTVTRTLLDGTRGPNERWNLSFLRRFYQ
ncbi:MAG: acyltransferase [Rhodothermales bacterium]|nr:acyltransferase [Rhodothermales bacterium]